MGLLTFSSFLSLLAPRFLWGGDSWHVLRDPTSHALPLDEQVWQAGPFKEPTQVTHLHSPLIVTPHTHLALRYVNTSLTVRSSGHPQEWNTTCSSSFKTSLPSRSRLRPASASDEEASRSPPRPRSRPSRADADPASSSVRRAERGSNLAVSSPASGEPSSPSPTRRAQHLAPPSGVPPPFHRTGSDASRSELSPRAAGTPHHKRRGCALEFALCIDSMALRARGLRQESCLYSHLTCI